MTKTPLKWSGGGDPQSYREIEGVGELAPRGANMLKEPRDERHKWRKLAMTGQTILKIIWVTQWAVSE